MRGKPVIVETGKEYRRITPACAGKTQFVPLTSYNERDHPRVCGENTTRPLLTLRLTGSPPRVRGKRSVSVARRPSGGITPACAGKTYRNIRASLPNWDHPRVCGENSSGAFSRMSDAGSPPRVRGKRPRLSRRDLRRGITPAHAGKTSNAVPQYVRTRDHPRVCGENTCLDHANGDEGGSPPRVRGKQNFFQFQLYLHRITPACAGKTIYKDWLTVMGGDHPRVCGENLPHWKR